MTTCCNSSTQTQTETQEQTPAVKPRFHVRNTADSYSVQVELPGVKKENVSLNLDRDILTVRAQRSTTPPADWKPLHRELSDVDYLLRLKLNVPVDDSKLSAQLADGVLNLSLPVKETAKPRTISVS
jgi:HSP20 family protein